MLNRRQRAYLEAMGIDVWVRRRVAERASVPTEAPNNSNLPPTQEPGRTKLLPPARGKVGMGVESVSDRKDTNLTQSIQSLPPSYPSPCQGEGIKVGSGGPFGAASALESLPEGEGINSERENNQKPSSFEAQVAKMGWEELRQTVAGCERCGLRQGCTQTVFGVGNQKTQWLIIGEAPGAEEDRLGEPFVGRAGQLLNAMLLAIGLKREEVFIANILKCRPPNNRDPKSEEAAACEPYLKRQIQLIKPRIIVAVGRIAGQNLLKTTTPIGQMRGKVYTYGEERIPVVVTYHPAYLLRSPREKRKAWQDLLFAKRVFDDTQKSGTS